MENKFFYIIVVIVLIYFFYKSYKNNNLLKEQKRIIIESNKEIERSDNNEHGFCDTMVDNLETPTRYVLPYHKDIPDKHRMRCQAIAVLIVKTI